MGPSTTASHLLLLLVCQVSILKTCVSRHLQSTPHASTASRNLFILHCSQATPGTISQRLALPSFSSIRRTPLPCYLSPQLSSILPFGLRGSQPHLSAPKVIPKSRSSLRLLPKTLLVRIPGLHTIRCSLIFFHCLNCSQLRLFRRLGAVLCHRAVVEPQQAAPTPVRDLGRRIGLA